MIHEERYKARDRMKVPSIEELFGIMARDGIGDDPAAIQELHTDAATRFPIVVRPETPRVLDKLADRTGGSLAGISGALLDAVVEASKPAGR